MSDKRITATYLVDDQYLLHLHENADGVEYACFNKNDRQEIFTGKITWENMNDCPIRGVAATARHLAIQDIGLTGEKVAAVASSMLEQFPAGYKILNQEKKEHSDKSEEKSIRFINSSYEEQFKIADNGVIEVDFPNRSFFQKCEYIDDYHLYLGYEVLHICQLAEMLERSDGTCQPEPLCLEEQAAWELGRKGFLAVQTCGNGYDYTLFDGEMNELDGGQLDAPELNLNEARDEILKSCGWDKVKMVKKDYDSLMEKAEEKAGQKRESVLGRLARLDSRSDGSSHPARDKGALR